MTSKICLVALVLCNKLLSSYEEISRRFRLRIDCSKKLFEKNLPKQALLFKSKLPNYTSKTVLLFLTIIIRELVFLRRRPKVSMQTIPTTTLTVEVAKCLNSQQRTIILTQDCLEFFKSCDTLDLYVNVPPAVDEPTYAIICKHRRLKIELELKVHIY